MGTVESQIQYLLHRIEALERENEKLINKNRNYAKLLRDTECAY